MIPVQLVTKMVIQMKKWLLFLGIGLVFFALGCGDDDDGQNPSESDLTLNFRATYAGQPLVMFTDTTQFYPYEANISVIFQTFQFYISHITLLQDNSGTTETIEVSPVELVSFNSLQTEEEANQGVSFDISAVPAGTYSGIKFWLGVDTVVNRTMRPQNFEIGHPLTFNHWSWASGYIYCSIEGRADLGSGNGYEGISYHAGNDDTFYREMTFNRPLDLNPGTDGEVNFKVDLRQLLINDQGEFLDFRANQILHADKDGFFGFIIDGLERSISQE